MAAGMAAMAVPAADPLPRWGAAHHLAASLVMLVALGAGHGAHQVAVPLPAAAHHGHGVALLGPAAPERGCPPHSPGC